MSRAYCCEACDAADPHWVIERWGDAVVTWACDAHLAGVCERLQRDHEVTKLSVQDARKLRERAQGRAGDAAATVRIAGYGQFLATRASAQRIIAEQLGDFSAGEPVTLDWTGVEAVTGAFASELASWLLRAGRKAGSQGMNDEVRETWETAVRRL